MSSAQGVPGWQTEELQDEWPDFDHENENERSNLSYGTQSVSFTVPLSTQIHTTTDFEPDTTPPGIKHHASTACPRTFSVPRETSSRSNALGAGGLPQAQSTPNPLFLPRAAAPPTDPRLKLFQFQYDTYTREHLSALVDSIAINTPSG